MLRDYTYTSPLTPRAIPRALSLTPTAGSAPRWELLSSPLPSVRVFHDSDPWPDCECPDCDCAEDENED